MYTQRTHATSARTQSARGVGLTAASPRRYFLEREAVCGCRLQVGVCLHVCVCVCIRVCVCVCVCVCVVVVVVCVWGLIRLVSVTYFVIVSNHSSELHSQGVW